MYIEAIILYAFWFIAWGIYNYYFNTKGFSTEFSSRRASIFFYFLFCLLFTTYDLVRYTVDLTSWGVGLFTIFLLYVTRNVYFARFSNSLFQMLWVYVLSIVITGDIIPLAFLFFIGHAPIFILPHLNNWGRIFIFIASFIGGIIFALVYNSFDFLPALLINSVIHTGFYALLRPLDRRFHTNIIN